ncbi:MAG: DUF4857 domain-containing protein [Rikenella sp.]|nr:DUF4857 domain-containing protein [Rikenella sp.]
MIRLSKILLLFLVTALLAWVLPWVYGFLGGARPGHPFTLYSSVSGQFSWLESSEQGVVRRDDTGQSLTDKEFDSILPFFYYRQLLSDNRFPDTVCGVPVTPQAVQTGNFMFRSSPRQVNTSPVGLYPLLESMSGRVDLEAPGDVFRIGREGITFIDCATNAVETEKSAAFTEAMRCAGFVFPARLIAGNPTTRKEYDEGFFIVDQSGRLFHLKQTQGRPFVRAVEQAAGTEIARIFVTEFRNRRYFAFLFDDAGQFYVLTTGDYALHPVDVPPVDPTRQGMMIVGNLLDWTLKIGDPDGAEHLYAVDGAAFGRLAEKHRPAPEERVFDGAARYLFPFRLSFTSRLDNEVRPRLTDFSPWALVLGAVLAVVYCVVRRNRPAAPPVLASVFILVCGLYAFVGLLLFDRRS